MPGGTSRWAGTSCLEAHWAQEQALLVVSKPLQDGDPGAFPTQNADLSPCHHRETTRDYADGQMVVRSIAQLLQTSKASEEESMQRLCSPAACGPNSDTKEAPRLQTAQEAAEVSRGEPS